MGLLKGGRLVNWGLQSLHWSKFWVRQHLSAFVAVFACSTCMGRGVRWKLRGGSPHPGGSCPTQVEANRGQHWQRGQVLAQLKCP